MLNRVTSIRAGAGPRLLAFALDYVVIAGYAALLAVVGLVTDVQALFSGPGRAQLSGFLVLVLPVVLYFALSESSPTQGTWGKRRLGLRVVDAHGRRPSVGRSLARAMLKFLPWEIAHAGVWRAVDWSSASSPPTSPHVWALFGASLLLAGIYVAGLFARPSHRTLYDRIAGTSVARGAR